jgi:hypothetical protein
MVALLLRSIGIIYRCVVITVIQRQLLKELRRYREVANKAERRISRDLNVQDQLEWAITTAAFTGKVQ